MNYTALRLGETDRPLHSAVSQRHVGDIRKLLRDSSSEVDEIEPNSGATPLYWAACLGVDSAVEVLLDANANVDATDKRGWTPLFAATASCNSKIVEQLLNAGASINLPSNDRMSPVILAAGLWVTGVKGTKNAPQKLEKIFNLLLDKKPDLEVEDTDGMTPLNSLICLGRKTKSLDKTINKVAKGLIAASASIDTSDARGKTPLHWAARSGYVEVVKTLLENNSFTDTSDDLGHTPLHLAVEGYMESSRDVQNCRSSSNAQIIQQLLDNDADPAIKSKHGLTPLGQARYLRFYNQISEEGYQSISQQLPPETLDERAVEKAIADTNWESSKRMFTHCLAGLAATVLVVSSCYNLFREREEVDL